MSIQESIQSFTNYPDTLGKAAALNHFKISSFDKNKIIFLSDKMLALAISVDSEISLHSDGASTAFALVNERIFDIEQNLLNANRAELFENKDGWKSELEDLNKAHYFLSKI
jgi:hypothetical protein